MVSPFLTVYGRTSMARVASRAAPGLAAERAPLLATCGLAPTKLVLALCIIMTAGVAGGQTRAQISG